jgi:hypothetical protein
MIQIQENQIQNSNLETLNGGRNRFTNAVTGAAIDTAEKLMPANSKAIFFALNTI